MSIGYNPSISTAGLFLCLDAGNKRSYPGSGTSWYDASTTNPASSLVNGPTYSSANLGTITFDGVDDYASSNITAGFTGAMTVITFGKSTNSIWNNWAGLGSARVNNGYIIHNNNGATTTTFYWLNSAGAYYSVGAVTPENIQNYNMYAMSTNGSTLHKAYLNGALAITDTQSISRTNTGSAQSTYLGLDDGAGRYNALSITYHAIYNTQLSDSQILQIYEALRSRYSI